MFIRLDGKTIVITGGNRGIGKAVAIELARRGGRIVFGCRDAQLAKAAADEIAKEVPNAPPITIHKLDLASIESINYFAQTILDTERSIDILINNAGVIATTKRTTSDGHELNWGVNHLGPFLLTLLLVERMKQSPNAKIISVGSASAVYVNSINFDNLSFAKGWNYMEAYGQSKLAIILITQELARRLPPNIHTYAVDPGFVKTDLFRENPAMFQLPVLSQMYKFGMSVSSKIGFRTAAQGAAPIIHCATSPEADVQSGLYYADCKPKKPTRAQTDAHMAAQLWKVSCEQVGLPLFKDKTTL